MEYQKRTILLDNETNPPSRFRTKNRIEIKYESCGTYDDNN